MFVLISSFLRVVGEWREIPHHEADWGVVVGWSGFLEFLDMKIIVYFVLSVI